MPDISGRLQYDAARTGAVSTTFLGIANVPIVLLDNGGTLLETSITDSNGNYSFTGIAAGSYSVSEAYNGIIGKCPPLADDNYVYVLNPPEGANALDCTMRNTRLVTLATDNLTGQDFLNGPVKYTPLVIDNIDNIVIKPNNLLVGADNGTFGFFAKGVAANTGAGTYPSQPYPELNSQFIYVEPQTGSSSPVTPNDDQYTVQNIMNSSHSNIAGTWWRIADHSTGNETGRMMVVNGDVVGSQILEMGFVVVKPNTYYLKSYWVLNLAKQAGLAQPKFGVQVVDQDDNIIASEDLGGEIPTNLICPEWKQVGTIIYSDNATALNVKFLSEGAAATGNDFVIDDVGFYEIAIPKVNPIKSVDKSVVCVGGVVEFTITLTNPSSNTNSITNVFFQDVLASEFEFVEDSLAVNGFIVLGANPSGFYTDIDIASGETTTISFKAQAISVPLSPNINPVTNMSNMSYEYTPITGGIETPFNVESNTVDVTIKEAALTVTKVVNCGYVISGGVVRYAITIENSSELIAAGIVLTDAISDLFIPNTVEYSLDNGDTWIAWLGTQELGDIYPNSKAMVLIKGVVVKGFSGIIVNQAKVDNYFCPVPDEAQEAEE